MHRALRRVQSERTGPARFDQDHSRAALSDVSWLTSARMVRSIMGTASFMRPFGLHIESELHEGSRGVRAQSVLDDGTRWPSYALGSQAFTGPGKCCGSDRSRMSGPCIGLLPDRGDRLGQAFSPSQTAMHTSSTQQFLTSVKPRASTLRPLRGLRPRFQGCRVRS